MRESHHAVGGVGVLGTPSSGGPVGHRAVDIDGQVVGRLVRRDGDEAAVQAVVRTVANDAVEVGLVAVVVAGTGGAGVAHTDHGLRLVHVGRGVVVIVVVIVRVYPRAV